MQTVARSALVPFSAEQMFELVADIDAYPEFLPWCGGARVLERAAERVVASIDIRYAGLHKSFTTENLLSPARQIDLRLVSGPFRHLRGRWSFAPLKPDGSRISLEMEFEFASGLMSRALGRVFASITDTMVSSFERRANALYGGAAR